MRTSLLAPPSPWERALPWALGGLFLALEILDCGTWHRGFSYLDEGSGAVCNLQEWIEGRSLPMELFKGCVHGHLSAALAWLIGPSMWDFRFLSLGALGLESFLLYRLALDMAGERAAVWTLAANFACAQVFLRARFALSCALLPCELLLFISLMRREWSGLGSFGFGAAAALLLLDYEGWQVALPIVALFWACQDARERPRLALALAGFVVVTALLVGMSWDGLGEHFARRLRSLPQAGLGPGLLLVKFMKSFVLGGECIGYLGVSNRPFVPAWALPGFGVGLAWALRHRRVLLAWLALGLLPAMTVAASAEPNRLVAAWPAMSLLCGVGLAWIASRVSAWPLLGLLMVGICWEALGYKESMDQGYAPWYGESAAVERLSEAYPRRRLVNELGPPYASQQRFAWGPRPSSDGAIYMVPVEFGPGLGKDAASLRLEPIAPGQGSLAYLDTGDAGLAMRLEGVSHALTQLRKELPRNAFRIHRDRCLAYLQAGQGDAWTRTAVLEEALTWSSSLGELPPALIRMALQERLVSASAPLWLAAKAHDSGDEAFAHRLCAKALAVDPARACAY